MIIKILHIQFLLIPKRDLDLCYEEETDGHYSNKKELLIWDMYDVHIFGTKLKIHKEFKRVIRIDNDCNSLNYTTILYPCERLFNILNENNAISDSMNFNNKIFFYRYSHINVDFKKYFLYKINFHFEISNLFDVQPQINTASIWFNVEE